MHRIVTVKGCPSRVAREERAHASCAARFAPMAAAACVTGRENDCLRPSEVMACTVLLTDGRWGGATLLELGRAVPALSRPAKVSEYEFMEDNRAQPYSSQATCLCPCHGMVRVVRTHRETRSCAGADRVPGIYDSDARLRPFQYPLDRQQLIYH